MRCMESNYWDLLSSREIPLGGEREFHMFREVVDRNYCRASRRWQRFQVFRIAEGVGPRTLRDGAFLQIPSGDEICPDLS